MGVGETWIKMSGLRHWRIRVARVMKKKLIINEKKIIRRAKKSYFKANEN